MLPATWLFCLAADSHEMLPTSVALLDTHPLIRRLRVRPRRVSNILSLIDYEIFSMVILSLMLIQEGQVSVSGERMCTTLVNRLNLPSKSVVR